MRETLPMRRRDVLALLGGAAAGLGAGTALAAYPERPVKIVSPFAAGGSSDLVARLLANRFEATLKQPCVVENKPGAAGILGVDFVAKAQPDGYTLVYLSGAITIQPSLMKVPYDVTRDLQPISQAIKVPYILVARPDSRFNSLQDVIAAARRGENVTFGTYGAGSPPHLLMELIQSRLNVKLLHIPYKTNAAQLVDLVGGRIDVMWDPPASLVGHIRSGKLKPLATSGAQRAFFLQQVPALGEVVPGLSVDGWGALMAPAGLPADKVAVLQKLVAEAVVHPDVAPKLKDQGFTPVGSTSEELARVIKEELVSWGTLIRERNIRLE